LLIVGHPNNPSGQTLPFERLRGWLLGTKNAVVVDESYLEFCDAPSTMTLFGQRPNLFVLRSMSGFSAFQVADRRLVGEPGRLVRSARSGSQGIRCNREVAARG
jgi:histidinol-phosphate aminotransferase